MEYQFNPFTGTFDIVSAETLQTAYDNGSDILQTTETIQVRDAGIAYGGTTLGAGFINESSRPVSIMNVVDDGGLGFANATFVKKVADTAATFPSASTVETGVDLIAAGVATAGAYGGPANGVLFIKDADVAADEGLYIIVSVANGSTTNSVATVVKPTTFGAPTFTSTTATVMVSNAVSGLGNSSGVQGIGLLVYGDNSWTAGTGALVDVRNNGGAYGNLMYMYNPAQGTAAVGSVSDAVVKFANLDVSGSSDVPTMKLVDASDGGALSIDRTTSGATGNSVTLNATLQDSFDVIFTGSRNNTDWSGLGYENSAYIATDDGMGMLVAASDDGTFRGIGGYIYLGAPSVTPDYGVLIATQDPNSAREDSLPIHIASGDIQSTGAGTGNMYINTGLVSNVANGGNTGALYMYTGSVAGTGDSGEIKIYTGAETGNGTGTGGLSLYTGDSTNGTSGEINIYTGDGVTTSALYLVTGNASAGNSGDVGIATGTATGTKGVVYIDSSRFQTAKGADVASANDMTLGAGNLFDITGTTTINTITGTGWQAGSVIILHFDGALTVTHNSGGTNDIMLAGSSNFSTAANSRLQLYFDGTDWWEISRTVA